MNSDLIRQPVLNGSKLDQNHLVETILQAALEQKLISPSAFESVQMALLSIVANEVERYTQGESSSVPAETARDITRSVLYGIDFELKSLPDPDSCLEALLKEPLPSLHAQGIKRIKACFEMSKELLEKVKTGRLPIEMHAYNDTIDQLPIFFSSYDCEFSAHESEGSIDYPLCVDRMDSVGIEYINGYLQKLYWENEFCRLFSVKSILGLLRGMSLRYGFPYQDMLDNIFELVLINALGAALLKRSPRELALSFADCGGLQDIFKDKPVGERGALLAGAARRMMNDLEIDASSPFVLYFAECLAKTGERLECFAADGRLSSLFILTGGDLPEADLYYQDGDRMDDDRFRSITDDLRSCNGISDKITLIRSEVHSMEDLADILAAYCIFDEEYACLFDSLEDTGLAMLLKKLPVDAEGRLTEETIADEALHLSECEGEWHRQLFDYLNSLGEERTATLLALMKRIIS